MLTTPISRGRLRSKAYAPLTLAIHLIVASAAGALVSTAALAQNSKATLVTRSIVVLIAVRP